MFNLLPSGEKKAVHKEYALRRSVIFFTFLLLLGLVSSAFILPSTTLSKQREREGLQQINNLRGVVTEEDKQTLDELLKKANSNTKALAPEKDTIPSYELISIILERLNDGIEVTGVVYSATGKEGVGVTLTGVAENRESLVLFARTLEDGKEFAKVDVPVSNLAKDKDINFTLQIDQN